MTDGLFAYTRTRAAAPRPDDKRCLMEGRERFWQKGTSGFDGRICDSLGSFNKVNRDAVHYIIIRHRALRYEARVGVPSGPL